MEDETFFIFLLVDQEIQTCNPVGVEGRGGVLLHGLAPAVTRMTPLQGKVLLHGLAPAVTRMTPLRGGVLLHGLTPTDTRMTPLQGEVLLLVLTPADTRMSPLWGGGSAPWVDTHGYPDDAPSGQDRAGAADDGMRDVEPIRGGMIVERNSNIEQRLSKKKLSSNHHWKIFIK